MHRMCITCLRPLRVWITRFPCGAIVNRLWGLSTILPQKSWGLSTVQCPIMYLRSVFASVVMACRKLLPALELRFSRVCANTADTSHCVLVVVFRWCNCVASFLFGGKLSTENLHPYYYCFCLGI